MNGKEVMGRSLKVNMAEPRQDGGGNGTPRGGRADRGTRGAGRGARGGFGAQRSTPQSTPSKTVFVGNMSFHTTQDILYEAFGNYGEVKNVRIPTDKETQQVKGWVRLAIVLSVIGIDPELFWILDSPTSSSVQWMKQRQPWRSSMRQTLVAGLFGLTLPKRGSPTPTLPLVVGYWSDQKFTPFINVYDRLQALAEGAVDVAASATVEAAVAGAVVGALGVDSANRPSLLLLARRLRSTTMSDLDLVFLLTRRIYGKVCKRKERSGNEETELNRELKTIPNIHARR